MACRHRLGGLERSLGATEAALALPKVATAPKSQR